MRSHAHAFITFFFAIAFVGEGIGVLAMARLDDRAEKRSAEWRHLAHTEDKFVDHWKDTARKFEDAARKWEGNFNQCREVLKGKSP